MTTTNVNASIERKLRAYPERVAGLAIKAVELSTAYSERDVAEQMKAVVRTAIREEARDDS